MKEYRYFDVNEEMNELFYEKGLTVIEEDFKTGLSFVVYSENDISDIFKEFGIAFESGDIEDTGWDTKWMDYLKPGWLTENIYYTYDKDENFDDRIVVHIHPGLAFGTGDHGTTQAAAVLMEEVCEGKSVIDAGCGSGILAIAAEKSGAKRVFAFDIDPGTLENAQTNVELNKCENIELWTGEIDSVYAQEPDIVVANIISSVLLMIKEGIYKLNPEYIVVSGVLVNEKKEFLEKFQSENYEIDASVIKGEWTGIRFKRK